MLNASSVSYTDLLPVSGLVGVFGVRSFACTLRKTTVLSSPATTISSRCLSTHTGAYSTFLTSRSLHTNSTLSFNALSKRSLTERRWTQSPIFRQTGCDLPYFEAESRPQRVSSEPSPRARGAVVTPIDMFGSRDVDTHFHSVRGVSQTAKLA